MAFVKTTEQASLYHHLEQKSTIELLHDINQEDQKVALAVQEQIESISRAVETIHEHMSEGGRLFYIGAGTSGRLGIVDASECPPTYGVPHDWVIGLMAGGDGAMRKAVEFAEDDPDLAWKDLSAYDIAPGDFVMGLAASGTTPYVVRGLERCQREGISTGCITCNAGAPIADYSDHPIEVVVGPEYVTGSTRMKAGTAQKLVLNMITTSVMIKLGRVIDNRMVDMQLSNHKLVDRGTKMVMKSTGLTYQESKELLLKYKSVRAAVKTFQS